MSVLARLAGGREARTVTRIPFDVGGDLRYGAATAAGVTVNQDNALRTTAVLACVRLIAETIASLPLATYVRNGTIRQPYPRPRWMDTPNAELTRFETIERYVASLLLDGNGYLLTPRDRLGTVTEIWPLHPSAVRPVRDANGVPCFEVSGTPGVLYGDELSHTRGFGVAGQLKGLSVIEYNRQSIGLAVAAEGYGAKWFGDGAMPSAVLETDAAVDERSAKELQAVWQQSHGQRRTTAVLGGGLKWKPISITPNESQFLETRAFGVDDIARIFQVPPHMIGSTTATTWGSGIEQMTMGFLQLCLRSWLERIEQRLTMLVSPQRAFVRFNVEGLLRADTAARYHAYMTARSAGWLSANEIRALEDMPPIDAADAAQYLQPLNMGPLGADKTTVAPAPDTTPTKGATP